MSLWLIRQPGGGPIAGTMVIYVDDLIIFAIRALCSAVLDAIKKVWQLSTPEWIEGALPVKFCGSEILRFSSGDRVNQQSYIAELLSKHAVNDEAAVPLVRWTEPEALEEPSPEEVKSAQALTSALLWLSTRSRPDIAYSVARMAQFSTRSPQLVLSIGNQVLRYLKGTATLALEYHEKVQHEWAVHGQLPRLRDDHLLELYSDASHGPGGARSMQASMVLWRGSLVLWEATKQPFVTLSSAESELVSMVNTIHLGEALQFVVEELLETSVHLALLGDNSASVRSFEIADASWRNRHLRLRAASGREKVDAGLLTVAHLPGEYQVADLGTKPLGRSRILQLLELANVRLSSSEVGKPVVQRALRRLAWVRGLEFGVSPATLLVLVLLALPQCARAQPVAPEDIWNLSSWGFGVLLVVVLLVGSGVLRMSVTSGLDTVDASEMSGNSQSDLPEGLHPLDPLREQEERTGLMLTQRSRLNRQLESGGIVDPPVMRQRFGSLPAWFRASAEGLNSVGNTQVLEGGSTSSVDQSPFPHPNVQIGGSTSSNTLPVPPQILLPQVLHQGVQVDIGDHLGSYGDLVSAADQQESEGSVCVGSSGERSPRSIVTEVVPGDFDAGSLEDFSRFIVATQGRRICWRVRDEIDNFLRKLLLVSGDVVFSFLGWEVREIFRLCGVARTYQYGVESALEVWRRSLLSDTRHAYVQGAPIEDFDVEDNSDIDRIPHRFPEDDGAGVGIVQQLLFHNSDDNRSEDSGTPTASPLSISLASLTVSGSQGETHEEIEVSALDRTPVPHSTANTTAPLSYEAIEGTLLVRYLDDCCQVPLPGWSLRAIQAVTDGLNQGHLDRELLESIYGSPNDIPQGPEGTAIQAVDAADVVESLELGLLIIDGVCWVLGLVFLWTLQGFDLRWMVALAWLWIVRRRTRSLQSATSWSQVPESLGMQGSSPATRDFSSTTVAFVPQPYLFLWLVLAVLLGLVTPSRAHSRELVVSSSALVTLPGEICDPMEGYYAEEGSGWWLWALWCIGIVIIWEACKWTMRRMFLRKRLQTAGSQTEACSYIELPLPDGVPNRAKYGNFGTSGGCTRRVQ